MNYIVNALYNFNLPFTLKDFSEYNEGYLATFTIDIPINGTTFTNIGLLIAMLERKFAVCFDSLDKDELTLFLVGEDINYGD